jgi:hypothetical protein
MSQYPFPYTPPNVSPSYGAPANLLGPAKRASIMMFILGPLLMACGGCVLSLPALIKVLPPENSRQMMEQMQNSHIPEAMFIPVVIVSGILLLLPGLTLTILGFFVRKGGAIPAVISMVLVGLILLYNVGSLVMALLHVTDANGASSACVDVIAVGIFGTLFLWLLQAARASSSIKLAQQQYHAQYWQYQQNMQAYMGYGQQQPTSGAGYASHGYTQQQQQQPGQPPTGLLPPGQPEPGTSSLQPPPPLPADPNAQPPQG